MPVNNLILCIRRGVLLTDNSGYSGYKGIIKSVSLEWIGIDHSCGFLLQVHNGCTTISSSGICGDSSNRVAGIVYVLMAAVAVAELWEQKQQ